MKITTSTQDLFVGFLIDESSSMYERTAEVIDGFNNWKAEQLEQDGNTFVTLSKFNTYYTQVSSGEELSQVPNLNQASYLPNGGTALFDAIDRAISDMDKWLVDNPGFTGKSLLIIQTDGGENSSGEVTNRDVVQARITDKRNNGWAVAFMGADIDAFSLGNSAGIAAGATLAYASASTGAAFSTLSNATTNYRSAPRTAASASAFFSSVDTSEVTPPVQQVAADLGVTTAVVSGNVSTLYNTATTEQGVNTPLWFHINSEPQPDVTWTFTSTADPIFGSDEYEDEDSIFAEQDTDDEEEF